MDPLRHRYLPAADSLRILCRGILILCFVAIGTALAVAATNPYAAWEKTLTPAAATPFPAIDPFRATYRFGWEGLGAGGAEVELAQGSEVNRRRIMARGGPNSLIRKLWNYQALYVGEAEVNGEAPSWFRMDEEVARGDLLSEAHFGDDSVYACHRFISEAKPWTFTPLPGVRDLFAAMLFVRSQALRNGDQLRLTVFPDQNSYLVDLTVAGRDTLTILGKNIRAIRFTVKIQTIRTRSPDLGRLAPHKKFRSGRVWMSDDRRRLPLRAEVDVFIGSVFAELSTLTPGL